MSSRICVAFSFASIDSSANKKIFNRKTAPIQPVAIPNKKVCNSNEISNTRFSDIESISSTDPMILNTANE